MKKPVINDHRLLGRLLLLMRLVEMDLVVPFNRGCQVGADRPGEDGDEGDKSDEDS